MIINKKLLDEGAKLTKDLMKEDADRFIVANKAKAFHNYIQGGSFISFTYNALHKDTLLFWDKYPAIIVLKVQGVRMLGLNLHFVPFPIRKLIAEYVIKLNYTNIKNNRPIQLDYQQIKKFLISINAMICIRLYLIRRITSSIKIVKSHKDYIIASTTLKTSMIYGISSDKIYQLAMGAKYSKKKKVGQRKYDREKRKKALKIK
jgi:hypothetical protein